MSTKEQIGMKERESVEKSLPTARSHAAAKDLSPSEKLTFSTKGLHPEVFAKRLANFRTGEDAALSVGLWEEEWQGKKQNNLTVAKRSKTDVRVARLHHEIELQASEEEKLQQLERQHQDAEAALRILEVEQRALAEERRRKAEEEERITMELLQSEIKEQEAALAQVEARRRESEAAEKLTMAMLEAEREAAQALLDTEAQAVRDLLATEREGGVGAQERAHADAMRLACAADAQSSQQSAGSVLDEEFGFEAVERQQIEADAKLARKLSQHRPPRSTEDERLARELQRLELRNYHQTKDQDRRGSLTSAPTSSAPASAPISATGLAPATVPAPEPAVTTGVLQSGVQYTDI